MISRSSSLASSTPATSWNVILFCFSEISRARALPKESALAPPPCIWRMKKIQTPMKRSIGNHFSTIVYHGAEMTPRASAPGRSVSLQRRHVGQVAVEALVIEPVAHDEDVGNGKSDVVEADVHLAALDLVDQHAHPQALGVAGLQRALEIGQREAGVDDVLDDDHVTALDRHAQVRHDTHVTGGLRAGVAHQPHEVGGEVEDL